MSGPSAVVGQTLGHYRILEQIGAGGMGVVFRAHDERLDRDVAVKILPSGALADESARKRFRKEALALSRLNHPNIATVFDFDSHNGTDFLVTELVSGASLDARLLSGPLPEKEVLRLGMQLAEGLAAAHAQGIVHRDLKPGNVRLTAEGRLKILDFGLAKVIHPAEAGAATASLSEVQGPAGTLPYMAPEQLLGETVDARTDLWAAGLLLYEMATGRRPFEAKSSAGLTDAILHATTPAPRQLQGKLSPRLEEIILKCLEKEPERRYQSAKELAVDLHRLQTPGAALPARPPRRVSYWRWALVAGAAAVVLAGVVLGLRVSGIRLSAGSQAIRTIAVLPLQNLSGDPSQDYFAAGVTEALTNDLARMENLQVISHTSAMQFAHANKPLPAIARELNADAVVEGSVQRAGDRVRVTAQLIRASTDRPLWADTYEREVPDILRLQDDVASAIAAQIERHLGGPRASPLPQAAAVNPQAYETYLRADYYLDNWDLGKSIDYFHQAIKLDPSFAPAYAHMARAYFFLAFGEDLPPNDGWGKVKQAATLALERDDRLPEAHGAMALAKMHYDWDFAGAEQEFKRALELNPNEAAIRHDYSHYLMAMGRMTEAEAEAQRALELDPMGDSLVGCLCWHSFAARDYGKAVQLADKALASSPDDPWERLILGWVEEQQGKTDQAIVDFKRASDATKGAPMYLAALGQAYARAGRKHDAQQVLGTLLQQAKTSYVSPFDVATIYAALGDKDAAFAWLDKAVAERSTFLVYSKWEPRLDPLRSDPRFKQLLKRIGLPE